LFLLVFGIVIVALAGEVRGRLGKKVVAVTTLDMDKAVRYSHHDPWQLLFRLCHVRHENILSVLGVLQNPWRVVTSVEGGEGKEFLIVFVVFVDFFFFSRRC
jgi:hypothetical protein